MKKNVDFLERRALAAFGRFPEVGFLEPLLDPPWPGSHVKKSRSIPEALRIMEKAVRKSSRPAWALVLRAETLRSPRFSLFQEAVQDLREAVRLEPHMAWIRAYLFRALDTLGKTDEAALHIEEAISQQPDCGWMWAWRGAWLLKKRRFEEALRDLDMAIKLAPYYPYAHAWRGQALRLAGKLKEAVRELKIAWRMKPDYLWTQGELILTYQKMGRMKEAAKIFADLYEKDIKFAHAQYQKPQECRELLKRLNAPALRLWRAWVHARLGLYQEAVKDLEQWRGARRAFFHLIYAQAQEALGDWRAARKHLGQALRIRSTSTVHGAIGLFWYRRGRLDRCIQALHRAVRREGATHALYLNVLGRAYWEKKQQQKALYYLNRALALYPDSYEALMCRGEIFKCMGKTRLASEDFLRARLLRAKVLMEQGFHSQAAQICEEILKRRPHHTGALRLYSEALANSGFFEKSARVLDSWVAFEPGNEQSWIARGAARRRALNFSGALADAKKARALNAQNSSASILLSESLRNLGDFTLAIIEASRAIEQEPSNAWAYVVRAKARRQGGDIDGALKDARSACRIEPGNAKAFAWQGEILRKQGRLPEALKSLEEAVRLEPSCAWAIALRGEVRRGLGDLKGCAEDLSLAVKWDPHCCCAYDFLGAEPPSVRADAAYAWVYAWRGAVLRARGRLEEAWQDLNWAARLDPRCFWIAAWRGGVALARGDKKQALINFKRSALLERLNLLKFFP